MIQNYVDELNNIKSEIIRNNQRNKLLKKRATELESNILAYLREKEQDGVKYKGKAIIVKTQEKIKPKKKQEKQEAIINVLYNAGINEPEAIYEKLLQAQKGESVEKQQLKIHTLK